MNGTHHDAVNNQSPKHLHEIAKTIFTVDICIKHQDEILMLRRSKTKKAFPGWLTLPGGHIDEGENPLSAALREAKEETGISLSPKELRLKFTAIHHHLDREEQYIVFGFLANLASKPTHLIHNIEGSLHWMSKNDLEVDTNLFPPVKYYLNHLLSGKGILYNNSLWKNTTLFKILSEQIDNNS